MLPVLRRVGRPASSVDPFFDEDFFGMSRSMDRLMSRMVDDLSLFNAPGAWNLSAALPALRGGYLSFPAEMVETDDEILISVEAPGFDLDHLNVTVEGNQLFISGERLQEEEVERPRYWVCERQFGRFQRIFTLPESADMDHVEASYDSGVLEIHVPKKEHARPRRLKIAGGGTLGRLLSGKKKKEKESEA
ncbi:MAG: Hsp20/alpha crystallin family protein [Gemmatimonadota bacterium]